MRESSTNRSKLSNKSVLEKAGITNGGQNTNSDRYLASRLSREFDNVLEMLGLSFDEPVDKSMVFDIMVYLMFLKSASQIGSEFTQTENLQIFESVWTKLSYRQMMNEYGSISVEQVRLFFFNMNYLWGDWLRREKLLSK